MTDENTPESIELERVKRAASKLHNSNEAYDEALRNGADPIEIPIAPLEKLGPGLQSESRSDNDDK